MANKRFEVIIIGKTGSGKSTLANLLLNLPNEQDAFAFPVGSDEHRVTVEPETFTNNIEKVKLTVIDTPGYFDETTTAKDTSPYILKAVRLVQTEVTAFILVMRWDELDSGAKVLKHIKEMIPELMANKTLIVFTRTKEPLGCNGSKAARTLNRIVEFGTFGISFIAVHKTNTSDAEERDKIRSEIIEKLKELSDRSIEPLTKHCFKEYAVHIFGKMIHDLDQDHVTYELLKRSTQINMDIYEEFISRDEIQRLIRQKKPKKIMIINKEKDEKNTSSSCNLS